MADVHRLYTNKNKARLAVVCTLSMTNFPVHQNIPFRCDLLGGLLALVALVAPLEEPRH